MNTTDEDILEVQGINSKGYGIIPKLVMQDTNLTATAKAIYAFFCSYAGAGQQAFPKQKTILHYLDLSEATYYRHFNLLKQYGYIMTRQTKDQRSKFSKTIYTLVTNPVPIEVEEKIPHPKFEGTEIECTEFECTQNKGDYINNSLIQSTVLYNHQSISQAKPKTDKTDVITKEVITNIKEQIEYSYFTENLPADIKLVDTLISFIAEMQVSPVTTICNQQYSRTSIQPFITDIDSTTILEFMEHIKQAQPKSKIKNPVKYWQVAFFNYVRDSQLALASIK